MFLTKTKMARRKTKKRASNRSRGRPLFSYPLALFLLMVMGVYLSAWTFKASGANILVSAQVHAPAVTDPAVITTPKNGQHFKNIPISVSGTCPANAGYVEIFRNNVLSGSALCDINGNFQLSVSLYSGRNDLVAHVFNITDDEGPVSSVVTVFYDAPNPPPHNNPPSSPSSSGGGNAATPAPLVLTTPFLYKGYYIGQKVDWPLRLSGGIAPYALSVDWGDGQNDVISRGAAGDFKIGHIYSAAGNYKNSYTIKVNAADGGGQKAFLQFFVIVTSQTIAGPTGNIFSKPPPSLPGSHSWLWMAWPAYLLVLVMFLSYWLGEREELIILRKKGLLRTRRP